MKVITDTSEWDAFAAEVAAYSTQRPDVGIAKMFTGGIAGRVPVFCIVAPHKSGDVTIKLVPEQDVRATFERIRAVNPVPEGEQ